MRAPMVIAAMLAAAVGTTKAINFHSVQFYSPVHELTGLCLNPKLSVLEKCTSSSPRMFMNTSNVSDPGSTRVYLQDGYPHQCVAFSLPTPRAPGRLSVEKCNPHNKLQAIEISDGNIAMNSDFLAFRPTRYYFGTNATSPTSDADGNIPVRVLVNGTEPPGARYYSRYETSADYYHLPASGSLAKYSTEGCLAAFGMISIGASVQIGPCAFSQKAATHHRVLPVQQTWLRQPKTGQLVLRYRSPEMCLSANGGLCPKLPVEGVSPLCFHACNESDALQAWDITRDGKIKNRVAGTCIEATATPIGGWWANRAKLSDCTKGTSFAVNTSLGSPFQAPV